MRSVFWVHIVHENFHFCFIFFFLFSLFSTQSFISDKTQHKNHLTKLNVIMSTDDDARLSYLKVLTFTDYPVWDYFTVKKQAVCFWFYWSILTICSVPASKSMAILIRNDRAKQIFDSLPVFDTSAHISQISSHIASCSLLPATRMGMSRSMGQFLTWLI